MEQATHSLQAGEAAFGKKSRLCWRERELCALQGALWERTSLPPGLVWAAGEGKAESFHRTCGAAEMQQESTVLISLEAWEFCYQRPMPSAPTQLWWLSWRSAPTSAGTLAKMISCSLPRQLALSAQCHWRACVGHSPRCAATPKDGGTAVKLLPAAIPALAAPNDSTARTGLLQAPV